MPERPFHLAEASDAVLDQALAELGREIAYPPTPDLAGQVAAALRQEDQRSVPVRTVPFRQRRWLVAAALLLLCAFGLLLIPQARTAIADRLGLPGVEIRWLDGAPTPLPAPDVSSLGLGRPVTLAAAREAVPFAILVPTSPPVGAPGDVYLLGAGDAAMVSFVYPASSDLPSGEVPGVGALLTQFAGNTNRGFIMKGLSQGADGPATSIEALSVAGSPGFWLEGAPHAFFLACDDDDNTCREEPYRLAGNVLLWDDDGVVLRLESGLSREASLAIAAAMSGADDPQPAAP